MVKCAFCKRVIEEAKYKTVKGKRYHYECYAAMIDQAETHNIKQSGKYTDASYKSLEEAITRMFEVTALPAGIEKQIEEYATKYGYTYFGMQKTLEYFHDVLGRVVIKEKPTIGIVPWFYDEARNYFERIEQVNQVNASIDLQNNEHTARIKPPHRGLPRSVNIEDL